MSIKRNGKIGGGLILGAMALAGVVASMEINQIRFGGPIQLKNQQVSDLGLRPINRIHNRAEV